MANTENVGSSIYKVSLKTFFTDKVLFVSYIFLALAAFGVLEMLYERYYLLSATAFDAGLNPGSREVADAMREAVFGNGGEVKREAPWSLYIVNYMYMIYVGSGIIFIVAMAELFEVEIIIKPAAGFLTLGLSMVFAGLFTIMMDLNILNIYWMVLNPQYGSGMWLMLPLYMVYIPLVILEIYLILNHHKEWIKKIAFMIIVVGVLVEFVEFYIQAKLFEMNSARHLWTTYPILPLYFMVSSFAASLAIMGLYSYIRCNSAALMYTLQQWTLYFVLFLGAYEAISYLFIDKKWAEIILFGDFKYYFYLYILLAVIIPFTLLFKHYLNKYFKLVASLSIIAGTFLGKAIFIYGGNAYPMTDRFGVGFEKYGEHDEVKDIIFFMPPLSEIAIVIGSIGVILFIFRMADLFFGISKLEGK
ncbi:MAG: polysulfide reductase [Sulfurimonas sp.]|nr:polysulfide reductase [Sulfurimonas sp.]MDQ7061617.1 polysulfide reductase [Sulfurimonas sp.]